MQLGNILATAQTPIVYRVIDFHVLGMTPDGKQSKVKAQAALGFVSEAERLESKRLAAQHRKAGDDLAEEEYYWFLLAALRDAEDPTRAFCAADAQGIAMFRASLVLDQVRWFLRQYDKFVLDEYPEMATPEQQKTLIEEAKGK